MNNQLELMQGNEACLEGALAAGMRFFAGYPITPSTEIAERASLRLPMVEGKFLQMEDEIASIAAVIGASAAGVKAMTATSGPGFSLMQENIGYAAMTEMPCVIVNVQRGGPSTGLPTSPSQGDVMQVRWGTHGDHPVIALSPSTVAEAYELMIRCFNLSEKYRVPVVFLMDEIVGHMREGVDRGELGKTPVFNRAYPTQVQEGWLPYHAEGPAEAPALPPFGLGMKYHVTGLIHDERGYPTSSAEKASALVTRLMRKIEDNRGDIITYEDAVPEDAEISVVCFGGTARSVRRVLKKAREAGIKAGMFRLITVWPFPEEEIRRLAARVKHLLVVELNYGQLVYEVERAARCACGVHHIGKVDGTILMPDEILQKMKEILEA